MRIQTRSIGGLTNSIGQDVRYGARALRRSPVFTIVAVLSIAGGLAAGIAMFAGINAVLFRPVAGSGSAELYRIFTGAHDGSPYSSSSYADYESFREAIGPACATHPARATISVDGRGDVHAGAVVSPDCFPALGLRPGLGQFFSPVTATSTPAPIVISHALWSRRFGSNPGIVGRTVLVNGMSAGVVAVAPAGFAGLSLDGGADFWVPVQMASAVLPAQAVGPRSARGFTIYARLRPGMSLEQTEASLALIASRLHRLDPMAWATERGTPRRITIMPEARARFAGSPGAAIALLAGIFAAIAIIVAIACLNLATMLVARGAARSREIAIRLAIGASRWRVLRQLATESMVIASLGCAVALGLVAAGIRLFNAYRPAEIPAFDVALDRRVILFSMLLACAAAILFGLAPAMHALRLAVAEGLKGHASPGKRRFGIGARDALIVLQVAVSVALLLVSSLFIDATSSGAPISPGFRTDGIAVATVHLDVVPEAQIGALTTQLLRVASDLPEVGRVSAAAVIPMSGSNRQTRVSIDGGAERIILANTVGPGYFSLLGIPLRRGREFATGDAIGAPPVAVISETAAKAFWGGEQAIGRHLVIDGRRFEVVGVAADRRYRSFTEPYQPVVYTTIAQDPQQRFIIHAELAASGRALASLDAALRAVDGRVAIESSRPMRARIEEAMGPERAARWGGGIVGAVQLALAIMALWGLVAYSVERRAPEMGVRLALGATPASLVRLTMRPAAILIAVGIATGCLLGAAIAKVMQASSVGLASIDYVAGIPVAIALAAVALSTAWWSARGAGMADPAATLRQE